MKRKPPTENLRRGNCSRKIPKINPEKRMMKQFCDAPESEQPKRAPAIECEQKN